MKLAIAAVLGLAMLTGIPSTAHAQTDPANQIIPSLDFDSVDVREALRALFKSVGVSYSIAPEVQGTVTVNLKNVRFDTALQNILKQVDATYRVEGGVYQIIKREPPVQQNPNETPGTTPAGNKVRRKVFVRHADPMFIAALIGSDKGQTSFTLAPEISSVIKGGSGGGMGGGGMGGGAAISPEDAQRMRDALRDIMTAPARLTIVRTESRMILITTGEGRVTRLSPDGKKIKDDSTKIERKTKWDGGK
ncbi:MAG: hypothetical protein ACHQ50_02010, partial [Fimbriimonadales bacterium]